MFLILYQITKVCLLVESRGKSERVFALVEKKKSLVICNVQWIFLQITIMAKASSKLHISAS